MGKKGNRKTSRRYVDQYQGEDGRIGAMAKLRNHVPSAYPGGPSHQPGSTIKVLSVLKDRQGQLIGFTEHNPIALTLHLAHGAAKRAAEIFKLLRFRETVFPNQTGEHQIIRNIENEAVLYDYFENCMTAVTFSYQSIEAFSNMIIADKYKPIIPKRVLRWFKGSYSVIELQRKNSTSEKLLSIIPKLASVNINKGHHALREFKMLRRQRDATIHLKKLTDYGVKGIDETSLFWHFYNTDPLKYPSIAIEVIGYFTEILQYEARWFELAREEIGGLAS